MLAKERPHKKLHREGTAKTNITMDIAAARLNRPRDNSVKTSWIAAQSTSLNQGLSKHQEMSFTSVTKVLQSNEGT